jgi:hypothetical protein
VLHWEYSPPWQLLWTRPGQPAEVVYNLEITDNEPGGGPQYQTPPDFAAALVADASGEAQPQVLFSTAHWAPAAS